MLRLSRYLSSHLTFAPARLLAALVLAAGLGASSLPVVGAGPTGGPLTKVYLPSVLKTEAQGQWMTIFQDDFEGSFPGAHWQLFEAGAGEYHWGARTCAAHSGTRSVWVQGGGADGSPLGCGANYQNNADSWMMYGPFDLSDAEAAEFSVQLIFNSEVTTELTELTEAIDRICLYASSDSFLFGGYCVGGSTAGAWVSRSLDLTSRLGDNSVWIALAFKSNATVTMPTGGLADDFLLRKCVGGPCTGLAAADAVAVPGLRDFAAPPRQIGR